MNNSPSSLTTPIIHMCMENGNRGQAFADNTGLMRLKHSSHVWLTQQCHISYKYLPKRYSDNTEATDCISMHNYPCKMTHVSVCTMVRKIQRQSAFFGADQQPCIFRNLTQFRLNVQDFCLILSFIPRRKPLHVPSLETAKI